MEKDAFGIIAGATALIGFVSIWIRLGVERGEQKKTVKLIEQQMAVHEAAIESLRKETGSIRLEIAKSFAKIEVTLEYIKESVTALKEARRAAEK
jgi:hypothetical protein